MKQYIVDAFTDTLFHGNQAAICVLDKWPEVSLMHSIAFENNFSETAFAIKMEDDETAPKYHLRWITSSDEVDLCGHATLATLSGQLIVNRNGDLYEMNFPVCGSGHCHIAPYWSGKMNKPEIIARQASRRGGTLYCRIEGERMILAGKATLYSVSELNC